MVEVHKQYYSRWMGNAIWNLISIGFLTFFYFLPAIANSERLECEKSTSLAYGMFGWVILGFDTLITLGFIIAYKCKTAGDPPISAMNEFMESAVMKYEIGHNGFIILAYAVFFYWTQILWTVVGDSNCMTGWNCLDFFIWLGLLLVCLAPAIIVAIGACACVCCFPCIIKFWREYRQ